MEFTIKIAERFLLPTKVKDLVALTGKSESTCCQYIQKWFKEEKLYKVDTYKYKVYPKVYRNLLQQEEDKLIPYVDEYYKIKNKLHECIQGMNIQEAEKVKN